MYVSEDYVNLRSSLYQDDKIDFTPITTYSIANLDPQGKLRPKGFITDWDGVLIDGILGEDVLVGLVRADPKYKIILPPIVAQIRETYVTRDFRKLKEVVEEQFRKVRIKERQLKEAYYDGYMQARKKWKLGADQLVSKLADRFFAIGVVSGSFIEPLVMMTEELGIPSEFVVGSYAHFENEEFVSLDLNMGAQRFFSKDYLLRKITGSSIGLNVFVSDDPVDEARFKVGINPFIVTGKHYERVAELSVHCPQADKDLRQILKPIDRWESLIVGCLEETPKDYLEIFNALDLLNHSYSLLLNSNQSNYQSNYYSNEKRFLSSVYNFLEKRTLFPRYETSLDRLIREVSLTTVPNLRMLAARKIYEKIREYTPEMYATDEYRNKVSQLAASRNTG